MAEISVGGLGVTVLDIHAKGQKHSLKNALQLANPKLRSHHKRMKMKNR